ncbi:2EXR domain-containing protein [Aspergillus undulatus]|uniref:2EXR domain-containing protein n=1 Tax=Aspergillus undulatus TaxID=1810928 RepID=UPI003CCE2802
MKTFHLFPHLPFDIRKRIWELAVVPRTVDVRAERVNGRWGQLLYVLSTTPVPAVLQTCHEARHLGPYRQAFNSNFEGAQSRYVWINFELDMISIGETYLDDEIYSVERPLIRRLAFERDNDEFYYRWENFKLRMYPSVEAMDVICADGLHYWWSAWRALYWPCPRENIRFIDKQSGRVAKGEDLQRIEEEWADTLSDGSDENNS